MPAMLTPATSPSSRKHPAPVAQPESCLPEMSPPEAAPLVGEWALEDASPYGLQGLAREPLRILKPEAVSRLAVFLALRATPRQIRNPEFIADVLRRHHDWVEEYHVVHLIEQSLWIQGHSDLVMTMTRNPSQIPDDPPPCINQALTDAYALHPDATVWYGVPLFGEVTTPEGLPIPLTADEVRQEAQRRLASAIQHALRWGWVYRAVRGCLQVPAACGRMLHRLFMRLQLLMRAAVGVYQRAKLNARRRARAEYFAHREYCRFGRVVDVPTPREMPLVDRLALRGLESAMLAEGLLSSVSPTAAVVPMVALKFLMITPMLLMPCDPFLFLELPDEPGKLRHLGHWYWQTHADGRRTLHLHS